MSPCQARSVSNTEIKTLNSRDKVANVSLICEISTSEEGGSLSAEVLPHSPCYVRPFGLGGTAAVRPAARVARDCRRIYSVTEYPYNASYYKRRSLCGIYHAVFKSHDDF